MNYYFLEQLVVGCMQQKGVSELELNDNTQTGPKNKHNWRYWRIVSHKDTGE